MFWISCLFKSGSEVVKLLVFEAANVTKGKCHAAKAKNCICCGFRDGGETEGAVGSVQVKTSEISAAAGTRRDLIEIAAENSITTAGGTIFNRALAEVSVKIAIGTGERTVGVGVAAGNDDGTGGVVDSVIRRACTPRFQIVANTQNGAEGSSLSGGTAACPWIGLDVKAQSWRGEEQCPISEGGVPVCDGI